MPVTKRSDLLPIRDEDSSPSPYRVFGLKEGEADLQVIRKKVQQTIVKIKAVRRDVAPELWKEVAALVQNSRVTLADPSKKAALDAQQVQPIDPAKAKAVSPSSDPLASLLPPVNPIAVTPAAVNPTAVNPIAVTPVVSTPVNPQEPAPTLAPTPSRSIPDGLFSGPAVNEEGSPIIRGENAAAQTAPQTASPTSSESIVVPKLVKSRPSEGSRSRKSTLRTLMSALVTISLLVLTGGITYFIFFGSGTLAISNKDGKFTISTKKPEERSSSVVSPPVELTPKNKPRQRDPVMGTRPAVKPPLGVPTSSDQPSRSMPPTPDVSSTSPAESPKPRDNPSMATPPREPEPQPQPEPAASMPEPSDEVTPAMIAATEERLTALRQAIRDRKWRALTEMSEAMIDQPMSADQTPVAQGLYQLAELATYYRVGIERAMEGLNTGADFEVTDDVRVIIVERNKTSLTVRFNAKSRTYLIDDLPFPLAHRLATFEIPEGPLREASKAVYQSLLPKTTTEHRSESVRLLRSLPEGSVDGVDPNKVIIALQSLIQG